MSNPPLKSDKFKVGLVYINTNNIGDIVIADTTKYLIERTLEDLDVQDYEIVPIDIGERVAGKIKVPTSYKNRQNELHEDSEEFIREWKSSKYNYYLERYELPKIQKVDLVVFAGGGLIKFHEQYFHMYIDEVTALSEELKIPVVLNAVGIEGYDESDSRCIFLKKAINRSCVKAISSRDDIELLEEKYIENKSIKTCKVSDPALWVPEAYGIKPNSSSDGPIGIGVIRPEIFSLYGSKVSKKYILEFYANLIKLLEKEDSEYKIFTNGGRRDYKFIEDLRKYMGRDESFNLRKEKIPKNGKALTKMINQYSRLITCRMHAAVIGTALGIPSVSLEWNRKQVFFAEMTSQPENIVRINEMKNARGVLEKIKKSRAPLLDEEVKNTDFIFVFSQVKRACNRKRMKEFLSALLSKRIGNSLLR